MSRWRASTASSAALRGPEHEKWASIIDEVVDEARAEAPDGVYVEPKGLTMTLHWRRAPQHRDWVLAFADREHARYGLAVHEGRTERELRPPIHVDKGTVVADLAAEHAGSRSAAAVFGDDMGDLPAYAAVGELTAPDGSPLLAVPVAAVDTESPREVAAHADLAVRGAAGAVELLRTMADARGPPAGAAPARPRSGRRPAGRPTSRPTSGRAPPGPRPPPARPVRPPPSPARRGARRPSPRRRRG